MNEIKIFENPAFGKIRTAGTSEEPLFCLADICRVLGLTNPSTVKSRLDTADVQLIDLHALNIGEGITSGNTTATFVTEGGFYDVVLYSKSDKVKPFRKWVTSEVLPSIRKTGSYNMPNFTNPAEAARAWADQYEKTLALEAKNKELRPKAQYFDALVERSLLTGFRDTAKELGLKQNEFIKILIDNGYVYKTPKGELRPIAKYTNDLFELKDFKSPHNEHAGVRTWITVKGKKVFQLLFGKQS